MARPKHTTHLLATVKVCGRTFRLVSDRLDEFATATWHEGKCFSDVATAREQALGLRMRKLEAEIESLKRRGAGL